jgi:hypothetical protein
MLTLCAIIPAFCIKQIIQDDTTLHVHASPATRRVIPPAVVRTACAEIVTRARARVLLVARIVPSTGGIISGLYTEIVTAEVSGVWGRFLDFWLRRVPPFSAA